jgi:superfamily II DNA or RNA helicase
LPVLTESISNKVVGKKLYDYQEEDLNLIFERFANCPPDYNLLYQLPTGGGKTVIFSEIARRYIKNTGKKVLILTHRIELCGQTHRMLTEFGVTNKVIDSKVKELSDQNDYLCFVAMVETLKNRLQDKLFSVEKIGLVIIDEAHYNSFRKLFKYFEKCFILGVTATPLSSNINLPMKDIYRELIVGNDISSLISKGFLAKATTFTYDVRLGSLKVGINGDYTVKSSEELYSSNRMQSKLLYAYNQRLKGKKTLIFNAGIVTSKNVYETFKDAKVPVRHLDSTMTKNQRKDILQWFKVTPNAVLTSVGILTTGFDEPTIEGIMLNRATRSLALYYQMIGRGSRVIGEKNTFQVVDLGNNAARFGLWSADVDWQKIFRSPQYFLQNIITDEEIERNFKYVMPDEIRERFNKTEDVYFDIKEENKRVVAAGLKTSTVLDRAIEQHANMVFENSADYGEALELVRLLNENIMDRIRRYCYCICNSTKNFRDWAKDDYTRKLKRQIANKF